MDFKIRDIEWGLLLTKIVLTLRSKISPTYRWTRYPVFLLILLSIVGAMPRLLLSLLIFLRLIHILYTFCRLEYEYENEVSEESNHKLGFVQLYTYSLAVMVMICEFLFLELLWGILFIIILDLFHYSMFWRKKQTFWYREISIMRTVISYALLFIYAFMHVFSGMWVILWYPAFLGLIVLTLVQMILYIFRPPQV